MTGSDSIKKRSSENLKVRWLREVLIKPSCECAAFIVLTPKTSERNQFDTPAARMSSQRARHLISVDIRQTNIQEDDFSPMCQSGLEHISPSVHHTHIVATGLKEHMNASGGIHVVIDNEDTLRVLTGAL